MGLGTQWPVYDCQQKQSHEFSNISLAAHQVSTNGTLANDILDHRQSPRLLRHLHEKCLYDIPDELGWSLMEVAILEVQPV